MIQQCINYNLLDENIPFLKAKSRTFSRKDTQHNSVNFWKQDLQVATLNWNHIYESLRSRVDLEKYHSNSEVKFIKKTNNKYLIQTHDDRFFEADYLIAADGSNSFIRNMVVPDTKLSYSGYVAWRGVVELLEEEILEFESSIPYYVFKNGHILLYQIPDLSYQKTGKTLLNWVLYQKFSESDLQELLIDKKGIKHTNSISAGYLRKNHFAHLKLLIENSLPNHVIDIVNRTKEPFLQVVADFGHFDYDNNDIAFVGDAALTLRPHTASGVLKALRNSIDLFNILNTQDFDFEKSILIWKEQQKSDASEDVVKSVIMGQNLVINTPDWFKMNHSLTEAWWNKIMSGKTWYAIRVSDHSIFKQQSKKNVLNSVNQDDIKLISKL